MELGIFLAESDEAIKYVSFAQSEINFGRSESCHLSLNDEGLADLHGSLFWSEDQLFVDRSANHLMIRVNDRVIEGPTPVLADDIISLGQTLFCAQIVHSKTESPLAPKTLSEKVVERDLVHRMGGKKEPSSLNSIYNALDESGQAGSKQVPSSGGPSSLNSIYNAYLDPNQSQQPAQEPLPSTNSKETPVPSKPKVSDAKSPPSLNSIYNSLTPIPEDIIAASLLEPTSDLKDDPNVELGHDTVIETKVTKVSAKASEANASNTGVDLPKLISDLFSPTMCRLFEKAFIQEIHITGHQKLSCKSKGVLQHLSDEAPFESSAQAMQVCEALILALNGSKACSASGRLGQFWVYANADSLGEPKLCFKRLSSLDSKNVIASDLLPQFGKFIARGARFAIASPQGQEHVAESVAGVIMQEYCQAKRFGLVGVQHHLGHDFAWFDLPFSNEGLNQAASLLLEGVIVSDHPVLAGDKLFDVLASVPSSMVLLSAKNPEAAFHKIRWRSVHKHLANQAVNMVIFAKEVNGQAQLTSIHSYATGEKVYGR